MEKQLNFLDGTKKYKWRKKVINTERVKYWLSQGAKASPTVDKILSIK